MNCQQALRPSPDHGSRVKTPFLDERALHPHFSMTPLCLGAFSRYADRVEKKRRRGAKREGGQTSMNTFSQMELAAMVANAAPAVKAVLFILAVMSVLSWAAIIRGAAAFAKAARNLRRGEAALGEAGDPSRAADALERIGDSPFAAAAARTCREVRAFSSSDAAALLAGQAFRNGLEAGGAAEVRRLSRGLGLLSACAGSSPFIGLFGTVWGIMHAFHQIGLSKAATLAMVAPGISEALLATAAGLCVAIPAALAHSAFGARLEAIEDGMEVFGKNLLARAAGTALSARRPDGGGGL